MQPAQHVIEKFGGIRPLARMLGPYLPDRETIEPSTVDRWLRPKPRGTEGLIPAHYHQPLLALAKDQDIELSAEELILGNRARSAQAA